MQTEREILEQTLSFLKTLENNVKPDNGDLTREQAIYKLNTIYFFLPNIIEQIERVLEAEQD